MRIFLPKKNPSTTEPPLYRLLTSVAITVSYLPKFYIDFNFIPAPPGLHQLINYCFIIREHAHT
jgi:hypothetical protein